MADDELEDRDEFEAWFAGRPEVERERAEWEWVQAGRIVRQYSGSEFEIALNMAEVDDEYRALTGGDDDGGDADA